MKTITKVFIAILTVFVIFTSNAQNKCNETLSLFAGNVTSKNFTEAKSQLNYLRKNCATINSAIYAHGETVLKHELKNATDKRAAALALIQLYKDRIENVPSKTKKGLILSKTGAVMVNYKIGAIKEQYDVFDKAFTTDQKNVKNPKYIYKYFELYYKMYASNEYDIQLENLIVKFEEITAKFTYEKKRLSKIKDDLFVKKENNQSLTAKEQKKVDLAIKNIEAIDQLSKNMTVLLEKVATCETLLPLFRKELEANKNNVQWLKRAAGRLDAKECTESSLFLELIVAIDATEPTANSKIYLYNIYKRKVDQEKAEKYLKEYLALETDPIKRGEMFNNIGSQAAKKGQKSKAREFFVKASKIKETSGIAYVNIARLYASSANQCGTDEFSKRATYWRAAEMARKAKQVDASKKTEAVELINFYMQSAPSKIDVFNKGYKGGEKIPIKCWVGGTVTVPKL